MRTIRRQAIRDGIKAILPQRVSLVYTDYRDDMSGCMKEIDKCIDNQNCYPLTEQEDDWFGDCREEGLRYEIKKAAKRLGISREAMEDFEYTEEYDELRELLWERDDSDPIEECLGRTLADGRLIVRSNYEAAQPHYSLGWDLMTDEYMVELMAWLRLNPAKVKKAILARYEDHQIHGRWPNMKSRDGKELVSYEDFVRCYGETECYGEFTFFGRLPLRKLYKNDFEVENNPSLWTMPKGTACCFFSSWNGGGSCEIIHTLRDITLKELEACNPNKQSKYSRVQLVLDEPHCNGYCSGEVYGDSLSDRDLLTA